MSDETCGHPTADGTPCQNPASEGDSCWIDAHGGSTSVGRDLTITEADHDAILDAARDGMSKSGCARAVGVDESTLRRYLDANDDFRREFNAVYSYDKYAPYKYTERGESGTVSMECDYCGSATEVRKCQVRKYERHYCNEECQRLDQFEENSRSYCGPNWRNQRQKALERDNYTCQSCGLAQDDHVKKYGYALHVHHIKPRRHFEDDDPEQNTLENLTTLCHSCHEVYEGTYLSPVDRNSVPKDPIATKTP